MSYKNILALVLLAQILPIHATSSIQETPNNHTIQITITSTSTKVDKHLPKEVAIVRAYESPSVATLQADKEFCLRTLSDEASDINALSPSGKTTLQLLTLYFINNFTTEKLIAQTLKRGANANVRDELERTPLFFVTAYALCPEVFAEKQAALDTSLSQEATKKSSSIAEAKKDTSVEKSNEKTEEVSTPKATRNPLHDRASSLAVVELLLAFSADPTVTDKDGISPLLLAVSTGDEEMVELFARYGLLERIFQDPSSVVATVTQESTDDIAQV
jgi:ankyrin repeat protein